MNRFFSCVVLLMLVVAAAATPVQAATVAWLGGNNSGDSSTWDTTFKNWNTSITTPWDSTNGYGNIASLGTASASVVDTVYANGITLGVSTVNNGTVSFGGTTPTITYSGTSTSAPSRINSTLTGSGLTTTGANSYLYLGGSTANTFSNLTAGTGWLHLNKDNVNAFGGNLKISASGGGLAAVLLDQAGNIPATAVVTLEVGTGGGYADLMLNGQNTEIAGLQSGSSTGAVGAAYDTGAAGTSATLTINNSSDYSFGGYLKNNWGGSTILSLVKKGTGKQTLTGGSDQYYSGTTTISEGVLNIQNAASLGNTTGGTSVAAGAALEIQNNIAIGAEALSLNGTGVSSGGALRNISGTNSFGGAVTLAGATRINSDAGTLTLGSTVSGATFGLTVGGAGNTTISGAIGITTGSLTKDGGGTLTLNGASNYSGGTTISGGTLVAGNNTACGTNTITIESAGTLNYGSAATLSNALAGSGTVNWTPAGGYSYLGGSLASFTGTVNVNTGVAGTSNFAFLSGSNKAGGASARWVLTGAWNSGQTGPYLVPSTGGTWALGELSGNGVLGGTYQTTTTWEIGARNSDSIFSGVIQNGYGGNGTVSISKVGSGTLALSGANVYAGTTTINAGALNIQKATALGTTAAGTTVIAGAALQIQGGITVGAETLSLNGAGVASDGALRNISGTNTYGGLVTLAGATRINSDAGTLILSNTTITGPTFGLTVGGAGNTTINSVIGTTTGSLTKDGAGTLKLGGLNTYSGSTSVNDGTLQLVGTGSINSTGSLTIDGPGAKLLQTSSTAVTPTITLTQGTLDGTSTVGAVFVANRAANTIAAGNGANGVLTTGSLTFNGQGTISLLNGSTLSVGELSFALGQPVTINASNSYWAGGNNKLIGYTGLMNFNQLTPGTITPASTRLTYVGLYNDIDRKEIGVTLAGDTPKWTGKDSTAWTTASTGDNGNWKLVTAGTKTDYIEADTVLFDDTATTANGAVTQGLVTLAANVSPGLTTFNNSLFDYTLSGTGGIAAGSLVKSGSGTLTVNTPNTYGGGTTVSGGTLVLGHNTAMGGGTLTLGGVSGSQSASVLTGGAYSIANPIAVVAGSSGTLTLGGSTANASTFSGGITLSNNLTVTQVADGTLNITTGAITSGAIGTQTLTLNNAGALNVSAAIGGGTGTVALTQSGAGATTLSTANTLSAVAINAGTVVANHVGALGGGGNITFGGGTLQFGSAVNNQTVAFGAQIQNSTANPIRLDTNGQTVTVSGVIPSSNTGGLVKTGLGTLTLSGANVYTGGTTITAGTLKIGGWLGAALSNVTVQSGATLDINGAAGAGNGAHYNINIAGTGASGLGALINNGADGSTSNGQTPNITLSADAAIGGTGSILMIAGGYGPDTLDLAGRTLTKIGTNPFYLCNTTVTAGAVRVSGGTFSTYNQPSNASAATFVLDNTAGAALGVFTGSLSVGSLAGGGTTGGWISLGTGGGTLEVGGLNTSTTFAGKITGTSGRLAKVGTGTLTLTGNSTGYTGTVAFNAGTLLLDKDAGNGSLGSGSILAPGGGTFKILGKSGENTTTETVASLSVNAGGSRIVLDPNGGTSTTLTITSGAITRSLGGAVTFDLSAGSVAKIAWNAALTGGIIGGGFMTTDSTGTGFATVDGGYVTRYTGGTTLTDSNPTDAAINFNTTGTVNNLVPAPLLNSLTIDTASGAGAWDLGSGNTATVTTGGLLVTGANDFAITSGTLKSGTATNSDLIVNQFGAGTMTIGSVIANGNGASVLSKLGSGTLIVTAANTYTGATYVRGGTLRLGSGADRLPTTTALTLDNTAGAALDLNGFNQTVATLSGGGAAGGNISLGAATGTLTVTSGTFGGAIGGDGGLTKAGAATTSTLTLSGSTANTYKGVTTVNPSTVNGQHAILELKKSGVHAFEGNLTINGGGNDGSYAVVLLSSAYPGNVPASTVITFNSTGGFADLALQGANLEVAGLSSTAIPPNSSTALRANIVNAWTSGTAAPATLTVNNSTDCAYAGGLGDSAGGPGVLSFTKKGSGKLTLSGGGSLHSLTGAIRVEGGTLELSGRAATADNGVFNNANARTIDVYQGGTLKVTGAYAIQSTTGIIALHGGALQVDVTEDAAGGSGSGLYLNNITMDTAASSIGTSSQKSYRVGYFTNSNVTVQASASGSSIAADIYGLTNGTGKDSLIFNVHRGAANADLTVSSKILNSGYPGMKLVKNNDGILALSGANTYTGTTTVNAGTLLVNGPSGSLAAASAVTVAAGATLGGNGTIGGSVSVLGGAHLVPGNAGAGILRTGSVALDSAVLDILGSGSSITSLAITGDFSFSGAPTLNVTGTFNPGTTYTIATYTGSLVGSEYFSTKNLPAGFTLDYGTSSNRAITLVPVVSDWNWGGNVEGFLTDWRKDTNWSTGTVPSGAGKKVVFGGSGSNPVADLFGSEKIVGQIVFNGDVGTTIRSTVVEPNLPESLILDNGQSDATVTVNAGTHTISAPLELSGNLAISGAGALAISGGVVGTGKTVTNGATLELTAGTVNIGSLVNTGAVSLAGATVDLHGGTISTGPSVSVTSGTLQNVGQIEDLSSAALPLVKTGEGTLTLSGTNNYTGGTVVGGGTLVISSASALPAGKSLSIGSGGTLILGGGMAMGAAASAEPVPEPGTLALLAIAGLAGVMIWRKRR